MKKLQIIEVNKFQYKLKDNEGKRYTYTFEFYDIEEKPQVGDVIYISEKLLDKNYEEYSSFYAFGNLNNLTGRKITEQNTQDIITIESKNKKKHLKRLYG